jgi:hypothetical protein
MYTPDTGSLGPQLGCIATDYVLLVMTHVQADVVDNFARNRSLVVAFAGSNSLRSLQATTR